MPIDERYDELADADWDAFARSWLEELQDPTFDPDDDSDSWSERVLIMNLLARPELQWRFILKAIALADSDDALGHIAAGPLEHLLGLHGETFIAQVEERAVIDPKFARTLTGMWRHVMSDSIWARVQALQARVSNPLPPDGTVN